MLGRKLQLSLVKDKPAKDETNSELKSDEFLTIVKEAGKTLVVGIVVVTFAGFLAKAGCDILVANLSPH